MILFFYLQEQGIDQLAGWITFLQQFNSVIGNIFSWLVIILVVMQSQVIAFIFVFTFIWMEKHFSIIYFQFFYSVICKQNE